MAVGKGMQWVLGARSETGFVRTANEDRMGFTRTPFGNVYVVSDGMGGYRGGALAAELTVCTLQNHLASLAPGHSAVPDRVREAFAAANQAVYERRRPDDPDTRNMGATGVVLVTAGTRVLVGNVGDSRAYLVPHRSGVLRQLTRDHTRVQKMVEAGVLTTIQAAEHPEANVLDRAIGHQLTVEVDVSGWIEVKPRDMVLLCSDGLSGYVDDGEIEKVVRSPGSPQQLADKLVELALSKGGEDNVTVQLVRFGQGASASRWQQFSRPAFVAPIAMLATAGVVWQVAASHLEAAKATMAQLEGRLGESRRERDGFQAQVKQLIAQNAQLKSRIDALVLADPPRSPEAGTKKAPAAPPPAPRAAPATKKGKDEQPRKGTAPSPTAPIRPATQAPANPPTGPAAGGAPPSTADSPASAPKTAETTPTPAPAPQAPAATPPNINPDP